MDDNTLYDIIQFAVLFALVTMLFYAFIEVRDTTATNENFGAAPDMHYDPHLASLYVQLYFDLKERRTPLDVIHYQQFKELAEKVLTDKSITPHDFDYKYTPRLQLLLTKLTNSLFAEQQLTYDHLLNEFLNNTRNSRT